MGEDDDSVVLCVDKAHTDEDYARRRVEFYRTHADFMERRAEKAERERDEARRESERLRAYAQAGCLPGQLGECLFPWEREGGDNDG